MKIAGIRVSCTRRGFLGGAAGAVAAAAALGSIRAAGVLAPERRSSGTRAAAGRGISGEVGQVSGAGQASESPRPARLRVRWREVVVASGDIGPSGSSLAG